MFNRKLPVLLALLLSMPTYAGDNKPTQDLTAVTNFMLTKDYPEFFGDKPYHIKIEDIFDADVLNDGTHDVVVHVIPSYRQSATILIYEIVADGGIRRITEGLAPGPLVPVTGDYIDSHTLGEGVDLTAGDKQNDTSARQKLIEVGLKQFGGFVSYKNFFHADGRKGPAWYLDMSDVDSPLEGKTCGNFEFSPVDAVVAGKISGADEGIYLVAKVGKQLYIYLINGSKDGIYLNKKLLIVPLPNDFSGFVEGEPSTVQYNTADGQKKNLSIIQGK